jgi:hypothetical protein
MKQISIFTVRMMFVLTVFSFFGCFSRDVPTSILVGIYGKNPDKYIVVSSIDAKKRLFEEPEYIYYSTSDSMILFSRMATYLNAGEQGYAKIWLTNVDKNDSLLVLGTQLSDALDLMVSIYIGPERDGAPPVFFHRNEDSPPIQTLYWKAIDDTVRVKHYFW